MQPQPPPDRPRPTHLPGLLGLLLLIAGLATGCGAGAGPRGTFILLPDPDGSVGQITVTNAQGSQRIDRAWQSVEVTAAQTAPPPPKAVTPERVRAQFQDVFTHLLQPPVCFILHFERDSVALTPASRELLPQVLDAIEQRRSADTSVVGHADTAGSQRYNLRLSLRRAEAVAQLLVKLGVDPGILEITSHGEENPLVPTPDGVEEARNRRVEITVR